MKFLVSLVLIVLAFFAQNNEVQANELADGSLVHLHLVLRSDNVETPWAAQVKSQIARFKGIVLEDNQILYIHSSPLAIEYAEAQVPGEGKRYALKLERSDLLAGVVLFRFAQDKPKGLKGLKLGQDLSPGSQLDFLAIAGEDRLVRFQAPFKNLGLETWSNYSWPVYECALPKTGMSLSLAVLHKQNLVGLVVREADTQVKVLPISVVKQFLKMRSDSEASAFADLGLAWQNDTTENQFRSLGLPEGVEGVWIDKVSPLSPFSGKLQAKDILTRWNNRSISRAGTYQHPLWGRVSLGQLSSALIPGEELNVEYYRDGTPQKLKVAIPRYRYGREAIPSLKQKKTDYLLLGGLLIQEASDALLLSLRGGSDLDSRILMEYFMETENERQEGLEHQKVFLQRVLPLDFNRGYHGLKGMPIRSFNGRKVHSIASLEEALKDAEALKSGSFRVVLEGEGKEIVLSYAGLDQARKYTMELYGVPGDARFWLP